MKSIEIKGKRQKDIINKANDPNNLDIVAKRDCMQEMPEFVFEYKFQVQMINKLYLESNEKIEDFEYRKECLREIDKKIASYKTQDINKKKYDDNNIKFQEVIEKLVICKLKCYYCKCTTRIFYQNVREMTQWTLDRIDNDLPHTNDNVIIACLKCNLARRRQNKDKFLFTKQLKIKKIDR